MISWRRRLASFLLLATALAGGPGFAGLEAYQHAHRHGPGHPHRIHLEQRGGQDHEDRCGASIASAPPRILPVCSAALKLPEVFRVSLHQAATVTRPEDRLHLPLSRAPPLQ
jgi:hypothetical protein